MGSKSSGAPAPDPRLVEAQIRSMGIQDDVIQRMLTNSEAMMPLQKEQLQFGLDSSREAHAQAQADRNWMLTRRDKLSGAQDQLVKDAERFNVGERGEQLAGEAMADVNQAFDSVRGQSARSLALRGITPGSGRSMAMEGQTRTAQALALAAGANNARKSARTEGYALTDRAVNALAGYPAMSAGATGSAAQFAANGLNLANAGAAGMNSSIGAAAQVAGQMGSNATGMFGAQASYKNAQDQLNQGSSAGELMGGIGGLVAGVAKAWPVLAASDRRLKTDIELVGTDAATGLNLYRFAYLAAPARRFIGVMADEVRRLMPEAVQRGADGFDRVNYGLLGLDMVEV